MLLFPLVLLCACGKEQVSGPDEAPGTTIHYVATVRESPVTRATLGGSSMADGYVFEEGDMLYVQNTDGTLYGKLDLASGGGTASATFSGTLTCAGEFKPSYSTELSATLVSSTDAIHTITGDKVTATAYPSTYVYAPLADCIRRYSHFTGSGTYGEGSFTLTQQSAIVLFTLVYETTESGPVTVDIQPSGGESSLLQVTGVPLTTNGSGAGKLELTGVFDPGTAVGDAKILVGSTTEVGTISSGATLAPNKYYTVTRSTLHWDGFAIKATVASTVVNMNYGTNHNNGAVEYSLDEGFSWTNCNSSTMIPLNAGQRVCIRSKRTTWNRWNTSPIFSSQDNKLCYISGNIMSLFCDSEWNIPPDFSNSTAAVDALNGTFANNGNEVTYIDIDPADPLLLPAMTLGNKTYRGMFKHCTSLHCAPELPAPTLVGSDGEGCYSEMFRDCSSLTYIKCLATNPGGTLGTSNWVSGVAATGTFVKASDVTWTTGVNGIPTGWTVEDYPSTP